MDDPTGSWLETLAYCLPASLVHDASGLPLAEAAEEIFGSYGAEGAEVATWWAASRYTYARGGLRCVGAGQTYLASLYWGFLMVSGGAEPSMGMSAHATTEQMVYIAILIFTQAVNAWVLATFTTVLLTSAPEQLAFQNRIDGLNAFMRENRSTITPAMRQRLREYLHESRHVQKGANHTKILQSLSPALQAEIAWKLNRRWVERVFFLRGAELRFLVQIALALVPAVYAPGERPASGRMYIIHRGISLYGGRMLTAGKVWGDDMLIPVAALRKPFECQAMNYLEVYFLTLDVLRTLLMTASAVTQRAIRMRQCWWMLRRKILALAKEELGLPPDALLADHAHGQKDTARSMVKASATASLLTRGLSGSPARRFSHEGFEAEGSKRKPSSFLATANAAGRAGSEAAAPPPRRTGGIGGRPQGSWCPSTNQRNTQRAGRIHPTNEPNDGRP